MQQHAFRLSIAHTSSSTVKYVGVSSATRTVLQTPSDPTLMTVDDPYVDGVSLTYGFSPRKHILTHMTHDV